jgi:hypothetical protein
VVPCVIADAFEVDLQQDLSAFPLHDSFSVPVLTDVPPALLWFSESVVEEVDALAPVQEWEQLLEVLCVLFSVATGVAAASFFTSVVAAGFSGACALANPRFIKSATATRAINFFISGYFK